MPDVDPGSLDRLHDIAVPPPVPWWPPAPGWLVIGGFLLAVVGLGCWGRYLRWRHDAYRREALRRLDQILGESPGLSSLPAIAELVKRVALAAYPRGRVASLTGEPWLVFLDETGRTDAFTRGDGRVLGDAAYRRDPIAGDADLSKLTNVIRHWIGHHRC